MYYDQPKFGYVGAVIAQWIRYPSCGPGFDPQAHHLCFFNLYLNCDEKRTRINKEESGIGLFFEIQLRLMSCLIADIRYTDWRFPVGFDALIRIQRKIKIFFMFRTM